MLLLSNFRTCNSLDRFRDAGHWETALRQKVGRAVEQFLNDGVLQPAGLKEKLDYKFRASDLKSMGRVRLVKGDFLRDPIGKTSPPGPVFFSVHMVAVSEGERSYTAGEIGGMLRKAGFRRIAFDPKDARGVGVVRTSRQGGDFTKG